MVGKKRRFPNAEDGLVGKIQDASTSSGAQSPSLSLGMGDDAALFVPRPGHETILTCDWFLEGTHFLRDTHPADTVGWKCLARAISDVAAMGGEPRCFLLSLTLPQTHTGPWLDNFLRGLRRAAQRFKCPLAGGDTTRRDRILINVTVVGEVRHGRAVLRSGARPGDLVFVSGRLGEAELGLRLLRKTERTPAKDPAVRKHLYPEPRIALGRWLADRRIATSMMDISDGLSTDLPRLCAASRVGARVFAAKLPTASSALMHRAEAASKDRPMERAATAETLRERNAPLAELLELALNGGDDYELLFTVRPQKTDSLPRAFQGIPLTNIGEITHQRRLKFVRPSGREEPLKPRGWDPFAR